MAALQTAFSSVRSRLPETGKSCVCRVRIQARSPAAKCAFVTHRPSQRSLRQRHNLFAQRCPPPGAQAAGDIALPGPGTQTEDVVLPEAGLINPSILNSEYDREIVGLAIPALGSILLDPFLSLVDTGEILLCYKSSPSCQVLTNACLSKPALTSVCLHSTCREVGICTTSSCRAQWVLVQFLQFPIQLPDGSHHAESCGSCGAE